MCATVILPFATEHKYLIMYQEAADFSYRTMSSINSSYKPTDAFVEWELHKMCTQYRKGAWDTFVAYVSAASTLNAQDRGIRGNHCLLMLTIPVVKFSCTLRNKE